MNARKDIESKWKWFVRWLKGKKRMPVQESPTHKPVIDTAIRNQLFEYFRQRFHEN